MKQLITKKILRFNKRLLIIGVLLMLGNTMPVVAQQADTIAVHDTTRVEVVVADTVQAAADQGKKASGEEGTITELSELISVPKILLTLFLLIGAYVVSLLVVRILDNLAERISRYRLLIKRAVPLARVIIWTLALYIIIEGVINPPIQTIITLLASLGIAVGFASQDILRNIFGGFMIILDRPFQVGDKIQVGDYYGEVQQIGLRSSRIVTPDDSVVSIPNGELMNKAVSNSNSSALDCQVVAEIFLPAHTDINTVKKIAYEAAVTSRYVYLKKPVVVLVKNEMHERSYVLKVRIKAYVLDIRYEFPFQSDMTELVIRELNRRGMVPEPARST